MNLLVFILCFGLCLGTARTFSVNNLMSNIFKNGLFGGSNFLGFSEKNLKTLIESNQLAGIDLDKAFPLASHSKPSRLTSKYYNGNELNRQIGGSCRDFFNNNTKNDCCSKRDDECYMIHYTTRCYCDLYCNRNNLRNFQTNPFDCCPDGGDVCPNTAVTSPKPPITTTRSPYKYQNFYHPKPSPPVFKPSKPVDDDDLLIPSGLYCKKFGVVYKNGYVLTENCKKCYCLDGVFKCVSKPCMVNSTVLMDINNKRSTWVAGNVSNFWGQTLEYGYANKLGAKLANVDFGEEKTYYASLTDFHYDFRWEPVLKDSQQSIVYDQGECAASWAFSTIDVLADRAAHNERSAIDASPSVEMLISCTNKYSSNNCEPIEINAGWAYIESFMPRSQGLVDDACYPLESAKAGVSSRCRIFEPNPNKCVDNRDYNRPYFKATRAYRVRSNTADIMHEIKKNGPVQMIFKVYSDFFMYLSGIYIPSPHAYIPDVPSPYHAVKVLGWGTQNGIDYWIAKNSWGANWGENGYFKIQREERLTEIGKHVYAAYCFYNR